MKDLQSFIAKNSTFPDNERLKNLYKELGLYNPLNDEIAGASSSKLNGGMIMEKTSRGMAL